jgi:hypothetical protein
MKALGHTGSVPSGVPRASGKAREHALFKHHPLAGQAHLSTGTVPTPYHVYDGHGVFIGGTADLAVARELLAPEQVKPVQTEEGRALMGVWVFDFTDASLGAHHELQFSLFVSADDLAPVTSRRLGLLELMLTRPDVRMLCHGLWNNTPNVVAYNRELLALNALESNSRIERDANEMSFAVRDTATDTPVLEGRIHRPQRASLLANLSLMARVGLRRLGALAAQPWISMPVLNPVSAALARNAAADTFTKAERSAIRHFDPTRDRLVFGDTRYRALKFQPQFIQSMDGFKFVYLFPK